MCLDNGTSKRRFHQQQCHIPKPMAVRSTNRNSPGLDQDQLQCHGGVERHGADRAARTGKADPTGALSTIERSTITSGIGRRWFGEGMAEFTADRLLDGRKGGRAHRSNAEPLLFVRPNSLLGWQIHAGRGANPPQKDSVEIEFYVRDSRPGGVLPQRPRYGARRRNSVIPRAPLRTGWVRARGGQVRLLPTAPSQVRHGYKRRRFTRMELCPRCSETTFKLAPSKKSIVAGTLYQ